MSRVQLMNRAEVPDLFRQQFELCNVLEGETIVVLSDLGTRVEYVEAAFAAAKSFKADIYEMKVNAIPSWTSVGGETAGSCKGAVEALKAVDLILAMHVPLFTKWMHEVRAAGTRVQMIVDHPLEYKVKPDSTAYINRFRLCDVLNLSEFTRVRINHSIRLWDHINSGPFSRSAHGVSV